VSTCRAPLSACVAQGPAPQRMSRAGAAGIVIAMFALATFSAAWAQTAAPPLRASVIAPPLPRSEEGVRWQALNPPQREALGPLEKEWPRIDAVRKKKWLAIADRYHSLPPNERARISERMTEWARLTPAERGEVRLRFQEARQIPAPDRSARWQAYQQLPADEKQQLAARASASSSMPGHVTAKGPSSAPTRDGTQPKANMVPNPALAQPPRPVAPTVVQAASGATTRLITRPVTPPPHQQSGMPKIAATPEFVNRSTLLPRRGPQAAAVIMPLPAPAATTAATLRPTPTGAIKAAGSEPRP